MALYKIYLLLLYHCLLCLGLYWSVCSVLLVFVLCCMLCCIEPTHRLVLGPTQRSGHIIDWLIACESDNLVSSVSVTDQLESDHKAVLACLNLSKPLRNSRLVTRRKLKTINKNKFGSDAAQRLSFIPSSSDPASHYNSTLRQLLDEHAPATTRLLPDRPYIRTLVHA